LGRTPTPETRDLDVNERDSIERRVRAELKAKIRKMQEMGRVNVKELEMDMRDWYMTAFKSSRHGYVGATISHLMKGHLGKQLHQASSPDPPVREASGGVEMAMSATADVNYEATPEADIEPAQPEMERDSTPQAGPFQLTPEPGGPEIGSWHIAGNRYVKVLGPPTLDPELDPLEEAYATVPVDNDGKREYFALSGFKEAVKAPKL